MGVIIGALIGALIWFLLLKPYLARYSYIPFPTPDIIDNYTWKKENDVKYRDKNKGAMPR